MKHAKVYKTVTLADSSRLLKAGWTALVLGAAALSSMNSSAAELVNVRVGINSVVSDAPFSIANKKGYFQEQGIKVSFVQFDAGPKMIAPLGIGQLEVAAGAMSAGLFNVAARGINIKVVADKGSTLNGYDYMPILVRKALVDSGKVKSYADLKGLKVRSVSNYLRPVLQLV